MPTHRSSLILALGSFLAVSSVANTLKLPSVLNLINPDPVYAQTKMVAPILATENSISLTAIPPRIGDLGEIKIKPGQKFQTTIKVLNSSDKDVEIETFVKDFVLDNDAKTPIQVKETVDNRWSLSSWVTLAPSRQMVAAKKTINVNVLIEVPKDARPGGHYAMVLHQPATTGKTDTEPTNTGINQQVGSLLYVTVEGPIKEEAFIRDFAFKPNLSEFGPMAFYYGIDNASDVHIRPNAKVEIYNLFNQKVDTIVIDTQNVFPGTQRAFNGVWSVKWGFGPYKAVLNVNYGSQGKMTTAQATAWIFPISIIIASMIVILAGITGTIAMKKRRGGTPPKASTSGLVGENTSENTSSESS